MLSSLTISSEGRRLLTNVTCPILPSSSVTIFFSELSWYCGGQAISSSTYVAAFRFGRKMAPSSVTYSPTTLPSSRLTRIVTPSTGLPSSSVFRMRRPGFEVFSMTMSFRFPGSSCTVIGLLFRI